MLLQSDAAYFADSGSDRGRAYRGTVEATDLSSTVRAALLRSRNAVAERCGVFCRFGIRSWANQNSVHCFTSASALTIKHFQVPTSFSEGLNKSLAALSH